MTLSHRRRACFVLIGVVVSAPFLASVEADAARPIVTFSGQPENGRGAQSCPSSPSTADLDVTPGSVVDFVNRTGKLATLWVGDDRKVMPDGSLVPVTFNRGPDLITISMLPDCPFDLGTHVNMTVQVQDGQVTAPSTPSAHAAVEVGSPIEPASADRGVSGLLALAAVAALLGVSATAIRAINAQPATRAFAP